MDRVIIERTAIEVVKEMSLKCNLVYAFQERELIDSKAWFIKFYMEDEDVQQIRIQVDAKIDRVSLKETIKRDLSSRFSSV